MADLSDGWLVEEGIGEHRAILLYGGTVRAAHIEWPGRLQSGEIAEAKLVSKAAGSARGTAQFPSGEEVLVDRLPANAAEGAPIRLEVVRSAMAEIGRFKLAHAQPTEKPAQPAPTLAQRLSARIVRSFGQGLWEELWPEAWDGYVEFAGGALIISPTPAMTVIDVDGHLPAAALARKAAGALCQAIPRFNIGGSVAVDFPTLERKDERKAIDAIIDESLRDWPHERTAMNGFGLVQIVSRRASPSLIERIAHDRAGAAARFVLRQAERISQPGTLLITCHPQVQAVICESWQAELAQRTGRRIEWRSDPALALQAGFAQAIAP